MVELEQWVMEGAYAKVLDARARAASASDAYTNHFLDQLSATVRCGAMVVWCGAGQSVCRSRFVCWLAAGRQQDEGPAE